MAIHISGLYHKFTRKGYSLDGKTFYSKAVAKEIINDLKEELKTIG